MVHSISDLAVSRARNAHSPTSGASRAGEANRASEAAHRASEAAHREGEIALTAALRANEVAPIASNVDFKVDALVVVGAVSPPKAAGLQAMATLVSEDVYSNLKVTNIDFLVLGCIGIVNSASVEG